MSYGRRSSRCSSPRSRGLLWLTEKLFLVALTAFGDSCETSVLVTLGSPRMLGRCCKQAQVVHRAAATQRTDKQSSAQLA